jgi:hypothetical protein
MQPGPGAPCPSEGEVVCASDERAVLSCKAGKYHEVASCDAGATCHDGSDHSKVACKIGGAIVTWYAGEGAPCFKDHVAACTFDGHAQLLCEAGTWVRDDACPGKCGHVDAGEPAVGGNCASNSTGCIACVLPSPGDPCSTPGHLFCDAEREGALRCDGSKFERAVTCPNGQACHDTTTFHSVACGAHEYLAIDGDPCSDPTQAACSLDRKTELRCSGAAWLPVACANGCGWVAPGQAGANGNCPANSKYGCSGCL